MAKKTVRELLDLAERALRGQGLPAESAKAMSEEFVAAEYSGKKTHGLGKMVSLNYGDLAAKPTIVVNGSLISANGNGGSGFLVMREIAEAASRVCRNTGLAVALSHNYSRYSSLYPYTELLAKEGFAAILANNAGPSAVAPYGGVDPVTGTNPICFSFPTSRGVQTFDFSTSEVVWGDIRQAALEGRSLAAGAFYDSNGSLTSRPDDVNSVKAFGGAKGWALNLALEILCGAVAGGQMGSKIKSEFDCGAILIAIDPIAAGGAKNLGELVSHLLSEVRASRPVDATKQVKCPGDRARGGGLAASALAERIEIPDTTLSLLGKLALGENVSQLSSNPLFN